MKFFENKGHVIVPSEGLIPHHPLAPLFTNAGMVQFIPYLLGEETPPYKRAASAQKCVRIKGKHDDIDQIGRTTRHGTFFEMLGNFSFGDYFKEQAIKFHWELFTEVYKMDGDRIWVTVHTEDDEAADIWHDMIGIPKERIQRTPDDNFWEMSDTGPCGPSSEMFIDRGEKFGEYGGPMGGGEDRYLEFANIVFTGYDRQADGSLIDLPSQNIDQGSGFERIAAIVQGVDSVWDTDIFRPVIAGAESVSGAPYGRDDEVDVSLRIMADHSRSMTFLVSDGVFPSNEDRGYVLRRLVRRMLRHASKVGAAGGVAKHMVSSVVDIMGAAYPDLVKNKDVIADVLDREEHRFRQTLQAGSNLLEQAIAKTDVISGDDAFKLHDTFGFPIELTREIALERGKGVDEEGFRTAMERQRRLARERAKGIDTRGVSVDAYREVLDVNGPTESLAYQCNEVDAEVVAVLQVPESKNFEIFLKSSPFYAEQGGQVGDTGRITTETGVANVLDTTWALPGLVRHVANVYDGHIEAGQVAHASIDTERRAAIRRNHTGTHILHWALREVLGNHVKQAGSLVAPDRLRFDFSHFTAMTSNEIAEVERIANEEILTDDEVEIVHLTKQEALDQGAVAFFGEKYGDDVRMLRAGKKSLELCGGTHVDALGKIGPIKITSEGSVGSNLRRIEAVTGTGAFEYIRSEENILAAAARSLKTKPEELTEAIERALVRQKELDAEVKSLRAQVRRAASASLIASAENGAVIARVDDTPANELREMALDLRSHDAVNVVVLIGTPDGSSVSLVAATRKGSGLDAGVLIADAARAVGGGGGKGGDLAMAGGRNASAIDEALDLARSALRPKTAGG